MFTSALGPSCFNLDSLLYEMEKKKNLPVGLIIPLFPRGRHIPACSRQEQKTPGAVVTHGKFFIYIKTNTEIVQIRNPITLFSNKVQRYVQLKVFVFLKKPDPAGPQTRSWVHR